MKTISEREFLNMMGDLNRAELTRVHIVKTLQEQGYIVEKDSDGEYIASKPVRKVYKGGRLIEVPQTVVLIGNDQSFNVDSDSNLEDVLSVIPLNEKSIVHCGTAEVVE